jgi:hypothetical protein
MLRIEIMDFVMLKIEFIDICVLLCICFFFKNFKQTVPNSTYQQQFHQRDGRW